MSMSGSARAKLRLSGTKVAGLGRGAQNFLALPMSLDRVGIKKAPVLPDPRRSVRLFVIIEGIEGDLPV